jgi:hypothetical protein
VAGERDRLAIADDGAEGAIDPGSMPRRIGNFVPPGMARCELDSHGGARDLSWASRDRQRFGIAARAEQAVRQSVPARSVKRMMEQA